MLEASHSLAGLKSTWNYDFVIDYYLEMRQFYLRSYPV